MAAHACECTRRESRKQFPTVQALPVKNPQTSAPRLDFLDTAKGVLVLLMVVYHALNYTNQLHLSFRYLSFLPPSFILITGFLISVVYFPRYVAGASGFWIRLLTRGGKLLLLFTALNVVAQYVRSPVYGQSIGLDGFFGRWHEIFVLGAGPTAAFEVLLPIAYLLVLSPALIWLAHANATLLTAVAAALVAACALLDATGHALANANLISAGLVGMVAGRVLPHPELLGRPLALSLVAYALYFPASLAVGYVYIVQLLGAAIALVLICSVSLRLDGDAWWRRRLTRIGQYSLLSYITQIAILQVLSRFVGRPDPLSSRAMLLYFGTLIIMAGIIELTDWLRKRARTVDTVYRVILA